MKYKVVESITGVHLLQLNVRDLIAEGWEPLGGVCFGAGAVRQAMIQRDDPNAHSPTLLALEKVAAAIQNIPGCDCDYCLFGSKESGLDSCVKIMALRAVQELIGGRQ